jgi:hypothetical protein
MFLFIKIKIGGNSSHHSNLDIFWTHSVNLNRKTNGLILVVSKITNFRLFEVHGVK